MKKLTLLLALTIFTFYFSYSQCSNPNAGDDFAVCGESAELSVENATTGHWTASALGGGFPMINFSSSTITNPVVSISSIAEDTQIIEFVWTDDSGPCNDAVLVEFVEVRTANAGEDQDVCGTCINLFYASVLTDGWLDPCILYPCIDPVTNIACVSSYGPISFTWQTNNQATTSTLMCSDQDDMTVTFYRNPTANITLGTNDTIVYGLTCLLYTSPSPRDVEESRMPSSA